MSTHSFPTIGDYVRVTRGPSAGHEGQVTEVWDDYGKVEVRADDGVGVITGRGSVAPIEPPQCCACSDPFEPEMVRDADGKWFHARCAERDELEGDRNVLAVMRARSAGRQP